MILEIEIWGRERPAVNIRLVIPLYNKPVTYCSSSGTAPYPRHLKILSGIHSYTDFCPISVDYTVCLLYYPHYLLCTVFHFAMVVFCLSALIWKAKVPRQLGFMLPTVQTKCRMRLPTVLKNYRVGTKKTFIFIAFQIPLALYMWEISARTVFL